MVNLFGRKNGGIEEKKYHTNINKIRLKLKPTKSATFVKHWTMKVQYNFFWSSKPVITVMLNIVKKKKKKRDLIIFFPVFLPASIYFDRTLPNQWIMQVKNRFL